MENKGNTSALSSGLANFISRNRVLLVAFLGGLLAVAVGLAIYFEVSKNMSLGEVRKAEALMELVEKYQTASEEDIKARHSAEIESTIASTAILGTPYANAQFHLTAASYWLKKENKDKAKESYLQALKSASEHLVPGITLDLADLQEQAGDTEAALKSLDIVIGKYSSDKMRAPLAGFRKARILDQAGKSTEALAAFKALVEAFPDSDWTKLARSRIIQLEK